MNSEQERLWAQVEATLDARERVADDARLSAALARDPELAAAVRRLEARLENLARPAQEPAPDPRGAGRALFLGLAAAGVLALGLAVRSQRSAVASVVHEARVAVERTTPEEPRGGRRLLEDKRVMAWTVDGRPAFPSDPGDRR